MSFDRIVEAIIKEAMERGEFDNLPSMGKPIDLTEYFETPLSDCQTIRLLSLYKSPLPCYTSGR
jgi:hypothetical protein